MARTAKLWHLLPHDPDAIHRFAQQAGVSTVVSQLLLNRGVHRPQEARGFLDAPLGSLHPPQLLPGMDDAARRITEAITAKRKICVYGDYDVDGTTGTAILYALLKRLGADVLFHIPARLQDGYGLNSEALRLRSAEGVTLFITVDCGIASLEEAEEARRLGVELIITDHHEMKAQLPNADVLVHPGLPGSAYPFHGLSGAGVALKLAWAVAQRVSGGEKVTPALREFLLDAVGLAALGLVADVMPLRDENRVLVRHGLQRMAARPSIGIRALLDAAKVGSNGVIRAEDVGFRLGPRINAAGRLECATLVVDLLTTTNTAHAKQVAEYLEKLNADRQSVERKITAQAKEMVEAAQYHEQPAIVLASPEWHPGVIGIVAGRITETYGRPTLIIAIRGEGEPATGSGRSIPGFALHEALQACDAVLVGHGGHAAAAGLKVRPEQIDALRERFTAHAAACFPNGPPPPRLVLDAELPLSALTFGLLREIEKLEPYGAENHRPRFLAVGLQIEGDPRRIGAGERHLSFRVNQGGTQMRAVGFGHGERLEELMADGGRCCLAFTPKINEWNGRRSVELEVIDLRAGDDPQLG
ncbi:MAG: single-stranded-DNA-specific exonuclease RecJ [Bacteroidales bacterium]|nr:single-stranded-DNA-specific exonuclease RecJ [Bacteroidales bacterium]